MLYPLHEAAYYSAQPLRLAAQAARLFWGSPLNPAARSRLGRTMFASAELISNLTRREGPQDRAKTFEGAPRVSTTPPR